jgi:hypothetical protein
MIAEYDEGKMERRAAIIIIFPANFDIGTESPRMLC